MTIDIYLGDSLKVLQTLPPKSVNCCITSPPYWGLRDYGVEGQIGLEMDIKAHMDILLKVFDEIKRVLKDDGICWVNYGDCYATTPNGRKAVDIVNDDRAFVDKPVSTIGPVFNKEARNRPPAGIHGDRGANHAKGRIESGGYVKPKDMCLLPERFVIAMQDAGWWVRAKPIWAKSNPMPESAKDRPTTSYEQIYMFTKSQKYRYDHQAVRITASEKTNPGNETFRNGQYINNEHNAVSGWDTGKGSHSTLKHNTGVKKSASFKRENNKRAVAHPGQTSGTHRPDREDKSYSDGTRSLRQWEKQPPVVPPEIWEIPTRPFKEAHFATFPPDLVYKCILASGCEKGDVIIDPFGGAGTTGLIADRMQMEAILIELNPEYIEIAEKRIKNEQGMFANVNIIDRKPSGLMAFEVSVSCEDFVFLIFSTTRAKAKAAGMQEIGFDYGFTDMRASRVQRLDWAAKTYTKTKIINLNAELPEGVEFYNEEEIL